MKILCDVHIARKVVRFFESVDIEATHVNDILDSWYTKDQDIAEFADQNGYVVITKDVDFRTSHLVKGSPKKLLKINLGNISTSRLIEILNTNLKFLEEQFENEKCFIEVNPDSIWINEG